jgi:gliding motility-associated-like protein
MGGPSIETGYSVIADAAGNVYTTGNFNGSVDFDPSPGFFILTANSTADTYISKFDPAGNFIWAKQMKGTDYAYGISIALDNMNNLFITGSFVGSVDFDPGPGLFNLTAIGRVDVFYEKLDSDGNFMWVQQIGTTLQNCTGNSITTDNSGNVIVAGMIGRGSLNDAFIKKVSTDGNLIWTKYFSGSSPNCKVRAVKTDAAGNVYSTGFFGSNTGSNPVDFDPGFAVYNLTGFGGTDIFVSKINKDGDFVWAKQIGGTLLEEGSGLALDALGNVIISGFFTGKIDADPGAGIYNFNAFGDEDIFVAKLNVSGDLLWARQMGGLDNEEGNSIAVDAAGNIYTTGHFYGIADFDPATTVNNISSAGFSDIFISKLDGNGNFRWVQQIGGAQYDWSYAITVDATGNIITTGYFDDVVDFDAGPAVYNLTTLGSKDIFVNKISPCANFSTATITASVCKNYTLNGETYYATGIYYQYLINAAGCDSILKLNLTVNEKFTVINKTICQGQSYYAGGANQTTSGIYKDTLLTSLGCDSIITTNLTVNKTLTPDLGPDRKLCINILAIITPGIFNSYLWQDNSTQPTYAVNRAGKYWVTVTDASNCSATDTLTILSIDTIPQNFLPDNQELCYGNILRLAVPNYSSYLWSTGSTAGFIDISTLGTYYLTVQDFNSCTGTDSITIQRKNCIYMGIPNAFTPDGNSINDVFKPTISQSIKDYHMIVFNRNGQTVFETRDYRKGWDGTFKGKKQPSASYVYLIKYTNIFGYETVENGAVLLIR